MKYKHFALLSVLLPLALATRSAAQDIGRVSPASLPLPLPTAAPVPPNVLRAQNPWNLTMTGTWRFRLTHGSIVAGQYVSVDNGPSSIMASTSQDGNPPYNAFDGSQNTRWCASGDSYPQWLQADLGAVRHVTTADLQWENSGDHYTCKIEGRVAGGPWTTLADETAAPGIGNGPVSLQGADVRFVRITVLATSGAGWASIREFQIHTEVNGVDTAWQPPVQKSVDNSPAVRDAFASDTYNDSAWDNISVPSNWEMSGYSLPTYDSVDNTVGLYRRWLVVPSTWKGKDVYWHFDGALDGAEIFVNGQKAGYHESGYTGFVVDLTGLIKPGQRNLFAVRVSKTVPSDDCETGDFQCMGGIYRDTSLIAVPPMHVSDITVQTPLSDGYKDATLDSQVVVQGTPGTAVALTGTLFHAGGARTPVLLTGEAKIGDDGSTTIVMRAPVKAPLLWSAEKPNLYYVVYQLTSAGKPIERVEQRFGFREIDIKNRIVLWNGVPIKCTGTCRHDFWADKGFALTEANWEKDLDLMKAANINAIRTSHYNHAQRFLELCEEKGMYVLDEIPFCWIGDEVKDPAYAPYLLQRATETLARDKNRPCVLAWSIGNENPAGPDSEAVLKLVNQVDPTRPAFVSCTSPADSPGASWEDDHYPDPNTVDRVAANASWGANFSENPHIFYQKETQDYDPGASDLWSEALGTVWSKVWNDPTILGSFIWEWQNQGIADKNIDKTQDFWYGPDHLRQENNKGIVDAYRNPKPEWWIVKMVYSPVQVTTRTIAAAGNAFNVPITNRYSFTNLNELTCKWSELTGQSVLRTGVKRISCKPLESTQVSFPALPAATTLRLEFDHPDGSSVVATNLSVDGAPAPTPPAAIAPGNALVVNDGTGTLTVSNNLQEIVFDKQAGLIRSWRVRGQDVLVGGPILNLGEAKAGGGKSFYLAPQPPVTADATVTAAAPTADGAVRVTVASNVLTAPGGASLGTFDATYDIQPSAEVAVNWTMHWSGQDTNLWDEGVKFTLPPDMKQQSWLRDSYFTDYPAGHIGAPTGTAHAGEPAFRATKRSLHWLTLTNAGGSGVALIQTDLPLVGRADTDASGATLYASREVAGPWDFSGNWVSKHDIKVGPSRPPLAGSFTLRAIAPQQIMGKI